MTNEETLARVREIGARVKALREKMPQDSPMHSAAFQTAALCGRIEAMLTSAPVKPGDGSDS